MIAPAARVTFAAMEDLFGHVPQKSAQQSEMFDPPPVVTRRAPHTPDSIRAEMLRLLAEARAAQTVPWTPRMLQSHRAMFPYMAEWLKGGEGDQLLLEFRTELERLGAA